MDNSVLGLFLAAGFVLLANPFVPAYFEVFPEVDLVGSQY
jgi:hypothetical protein